MTIPVAFITTAMAAYSGLMAVKALTEGDYMGAVMAGVGAFAGFSAASAMGAFGGGASLGEAVSSAVGTSNTAASFGKDIAGVAGGLPSSPVVDTAPAWFNATTETAPSFLNNLGKAPQVAGQASSAVPTPYMPTKETGFLEGTWNTAKDIGSSAMDTIKDLGGGLFEDGGGNVVDKAGNVVKEASQNPLIQLGMGLGKPLLQGAMAERMADKQMEQAEKDRAAQQEREDKRQRSRFVTSGSPQEIMARNNKIRNMVRGQ